MAAQLPPEVAEYVKSIRDYLLGALRMEDSVSDLGAIDDEVGVIGFSTEDGADYFIEIKPA